MSILDIIKSVLSAAAKLIPVKLRPGGKVDKL